MSFDLEAQKHIKKALTSLLMGNRDGSKGSGFFGLLLSKMIWKQDNNIPTMATDGKHIFYNTEFVKKLSIQEFCL